MTIKLNPKTALINAVKTSDSPIAFLVGSALSKDEGGGVPDVYQMVDLVRDEVRSELPGELADFDNEMKNKSGADSYQAAMAWLQANLRQPAVNGVVAKAVKQARKPGAPTTFNLDGDASDWHLTRGVQQLAELVAREQERFAGPILTTNFDPMLFHAIKAAGRHADIRVIYSDGIISGRVKQDEGAIDIVHLHGYWRDSTTLNTLGQLTSARPQLKGSLQNLLRRCTLVVVAYGGWDDVFANALAELLNDVEANLDVLWCFYESDSAEVEVRYKKLLDRVAPAITSGQFLAYGSIDCHSIFAELSSIPVTPAASVRLSPLVMSPLAGWEQIDSAHLALLPPLGVGEVVRYFDGAVPTWRHAVSDAIPRRRGVFKVVGRLRNIRLAEDDFSLQLIRAASGEGKTTMLLQSAADIARTRGWTVLWRPSPNIRLLPDNLIKLDSDRRWLLVADDADNLISDLNESARRLHAAGRTNVHFLLAARDTDWHFMHGDIKLRNGLLKRQKDIVLRGLSLDSAQDAQVIVEAWQKYDKAGLGALAALEPAKRAAALEQAVRDAERSQGDGSLFGGLLTVRFGQDGLQAHVSDFLSRLQEIHIQDSRNHSSLFDALLYVAACHGVGIPGIDANVLADLVSVPRSWVYTRVVRPLGEEAVAVQSAGHVFTRHSRVAAAVLVEAERSFGVELAEIWTKLVRQTVRTIEDGRVQHPTFRQIVRAGTRLQQALPQQLREERRKEIAIAAALADVAAQPERLGSIIDLGKTYRRADKLLEASKVFRDKLAYASTRAKADALAEAHKGESAKGAPADFIRNYWYEWSVCEGERGKEREQAVVDAWLGGISLSDHLNPAPITDERIKRSCAGLGVAFGKLAEPRPDCPYAKARRAVTFLGRLMRDDPKGARYYDKYDREADKIKTPRPKDIAEAIEWLTVGVAQSGCELKDPFLSSLAAPIQISFQHLHAILI
jgi:hypothetical protein